MTNAAQRLGRRGRVAARERLRQRDWTPDAIKLVIITGLLLLAGLVMSFSASVVDAAEGGDAFGILRRQLAWAGIAVPVFLVMSTVDHKMLRRVSFLGMIIALAGLVAVLIPGVGVTRGGAQRWIALGPMVVQPSEIAKLATLVWLADVLDRKRPKKGQPFEVKHLLIPAIPLLAIEAVLIMKEPDLGTTVLLGLVVALVLFHEGLPMRMFAVFGGLAAAGIGVLSAAAPYRVARITGWLHPELDPTGTGYQALQAKYAIGAGGWSGVGLGSSRGKWNWIPNPETDFVYAIIGEELGLIGALGIILLFVALAVVGLRVARGAPDGFARTVAFGITGWLSLQAVINIGTVVGLLPITGMTLPLVSAGGSSLLATMVALGILVSIARAPGGTMGGAQPRRQRIGHRT